MKDKEILSRITNKPFTISIGNDVTRTALIISEKCVEIYDESNQLVHTMENERAIDFINKFIESYKNKGEVLAETHESNKNPEKKSVFNKIAKKPQQKKASILV